MAVTGAIGVTRHALARALLVAGLAAAGWFLLVALGGAPAAAADNAEATGTDRTAGTQEHDTRQATGKATPSGSSGGGSGQSGLLGTVGDTVSAATSSADGTVSAVTETVSSVRRDATEATREAVESVTAPEAPPSIGDAAPDTTPVTGVNAETVTVADTERHRQPEPRQSHEADSPAGDGESGEQRQAPLQRDGEPREPAYQEQRSPASGAVTDERADTAVQVPASPSPAGGGGSAALSAPDAPTTSKQQLAVLEPCPSLGADDLLGAAACHATGGTATNAALPCTSPD
ncbi:hypothetical protein [Haloechinothrix sp. LS1_15]|uniref:hypothetical protein n=1 Tax=Haloechinothrix sp. LS1_15 TaxID=2652248 RepID=UPI002947B74C|nr:hypothetical protein [Haloechinothrix sp. LS1_15]MDV6012600.1 hypothetical protein [Haloechinothrix sp. LS1_15]